MQTFVQKFREQEFIKVYNRLIKVDSLINQLIYGKKLRCINHKNGRQQQISIYLHQKNPQMLMAILPNDKIVPFDLKGLKIKDIKLQDNLQIKKSQIEKVLKIQDFGSNALILLFSHKAQKEKFAKYLSQIANEMKKIPSQIDTEIFKNFILIDKDKSHTMEIQQFMILLKQLKISAGTKQAERVIKFIGYDKNTKKAINIKQFERLSKFLMCKLQFKQQFQTYTNFRQKQDSYYFQKVMTKQSFMQFLCLTQQQNMVSATKIAEKLFKIQSQKLSFVDFCIFMTSHYNNITSDEYYKSYVNQNRPLNQYYCYSSHNTYLTGDQLMSESNAARYRQDLDNGIRCVEIDCHDGVQEPLVTHGLTATSNITLSSVLAEISRFQVKMGYKHTPIILSIENHCNFKNQKKMVELMQKYFKCRIFKISQFEEDVEKYEKYQNAIIQQQKLKKAQKIFQYKPIYKHKYPTLKQLQGKIIIKCSGNYQAYKKIKQYKKIVKQILQQTDKNINQYNQKNIKRQEIDSAELLKKFIQHTINKKKQTQLIQQIQFLKNKFKLTEEMIEITAMFGKGKIGQHKYWESTSIKEQQLLQNYRYAPARQQLMNHVEKSWVRVYPDGLRTDSSNYNPFPALQMGVQLIAFNTQTSDYYSLILYYFFQKNSKNVTGYREKTIRSDVSKEQKKYFSFRPISAYKIYYENIQLRNNIPPCQVFMRLFCHSTDMKANKSIVQWKAYTQQIRQNGFNPIFKQSQSIEIVCQCINLAFVAVQIKGVGIGVIPLQNIRKGYRYVSLYDSHMTAKQSKIFLLVK